MTFLWLLEGIRTPFLDKLMQFITYFGQEIIIIAVICALYWCADKRFAYLLGFTYFTAGLCVQSLKITFRIPRPWILDPDFHAVESAIPGATGYSFPSGHTQGATCLFFPLALKASFCVSLLSLPLDSPGCIWAATRPKMCWHPWASLFWYLPLSGTIRSFSWMTPST